MKKAENKKTANTVLDVVFCYSSLKGLRHRGRVLTGFEFLEFLLWLRRLRTQLVFMRIWVLSLASLSGLKDLVLPQAADEITDAVLDPVLLWLWGRPGAAALIRPLAWELPYATGAAPKRQK